MVRRLVCSVLSNEVSKGVISQLCYMDFGHPIPEKVQQICLFTHFQPRISSFAYAYFLSYLHLPVESRVYYSKKLSGSLWNGKGKISVYGLKFAVIHPFSHPKSTFSPPVFTPEWYAGVVSRIYLNSFKVSLIPSVENPSLFEAASAMVEGNGSVGSAVYLFTSMYNHNCGNYKFEVSFFMKSTVSRNLTVLSFQSPMLMSGGPQTISLT